jgi:hypothetical protein
VIFGLSMTRATPLGQSGRCHNKPTSHILETGLTTMSITCSLSQLSRFRNPSFLWSPTLKFLGIHGSADPFIGCWVYWVEKPRFLESQSRARYSAVHQSKDRERGFHYFSEHNTRIHVQG